MHSPESLLSSAGFVRNLARSMLRDGNSADDVAQQTLLVAMQRPPRSARGLRTWLGSVVRSIARQNARGEDRRRRREASVARTESVPSAAEVLEREALRGTVVRAVLALGEPARSTVLLRYYEDKSPREIARLQGVPVETVRTRIKRGLAELRRELDSRLGGERGGWAQALLPLAMSGARGGTVAVGLQVAAGLGAMLLGVASLRLVLGPRDDPGRDPGSAAPAGAAPVASASAPSGEAAAPKRERVAASAPVQERLLSGSVADPRGRPLARTVLYVSPEAAPPARFRYHPEWIASLEQQGTRFEFLETDAEGRFRAAFADHPRVYVAVVEPRDPFLWADPLQGRWLDLPASDVALQVALAPTAEVAVLARVQGSGAQVAAFDCGAQRVSDALVLPGVQARAGRAVLTLPFHPTWSPDEFDLSAEAPELGRASARVRLAPGERREVELSFDAVLALTGRVVDPDGAPVADALVCSGTQIRLRGDEPFKPFEPARVEDGARTDASGWFALEASERYVTVWHPDWSPKTVARAKAALVPLEARAVVRGRLFGRDGRAVSGATLALDRRRETVTDELGRFVFEGVEAGVRGLRLPEKRWVALTVLPGETLEVELGAEERLEVVLEVRRGGEPWLAEIGGVGVGTERISEVVEFRSQDGRLQLSGLRPGRYVLLSGTGDLAVVDLARASAELELGTTPLTVHARPGTRVYLVPAGANELVELLAGRVASRTASAEGVVQYSGLPPGRYGVGIDRCGVALEVELADAPAEVRLE
jgi:RNA polymerase sigma-70 factor (ECF subfamily)